MKVKFKRLLTALFAVFFIAFVSVMVTTTANAAVGDRGTDQSEYQGTYGRSGYGDEKFQINQIGGYYNGRFVPHWTYGTQTSSDLARGIRAHTYIYAQFSGRYQADQMLNYYLPRIQTPKGSIVALDVESGLPDTDSVMYALWRIKAAGYTPVLYGYKNFLLNHLNLQYISNNYPLWLAEYPDYSVRRYPNYGFFPSFNNVAIFQFTSTYVWGGLDGDVDLTGITNNGYGGNWTQRSQPQVPARQQQPRTPNKQVGNAWYTVRSGDSFWSIAQRYGMNMYTLATNNGLSINSIIYPGQRLKVVTSNNNNSSSYYNVKSGDCFWSIAQRYGMSMYTLAANNGLSINSVIYPGQRLRVTWSAGTTQKKYTVKYGDSFWLIGQRFGESMYTVATKNGLSIYSVIHPGQKLNI
ncbi:LysM peptidoglycan-binding domain-containing protein [Limosilactobacillus antri]|uniref:LysM peptidoglycan-binding domain-containing protein n=1 Tax=Limosilactobacillus antri TaxID=227943 RepID=UPI001F573300|nr:LysM peptidoglycan-binding domain-containing protein [Limosilactobacillus antri]